MADGQVINPSSSVPALLPPYPELILAAIETLDQGKGAKETAISKHRRRVRSDARRSFRSFISSSQQNEAIWRAHDAKNNYMKAECDEFPFPPYPVLIVKAIEAVDKENGASKRAAHHLNK